MQEYVPVSSEMHPPARKRDITHKPKANLIALLKEQQQQSTVHGLVQILMRSLTAQANITRRILCVSVISHLF